jgi:hypothetical protein
LALRTPLAALDSIGILLNLRTVNKTDVGKSLFSCIL